MTCRIAGAVLLLLALLGGTALAGPFEDGVKAYNKGDYGAAAREFGKAARQGHLDAQANLGVLFELGRGVKRDHSEAAFWYRMAAENGHLAARFNLALKYRKGQGVPKDLGKAAKWLAEAAAGGDEQSKRLLGAVRAEIKALAAKPKQPAPTPAQAAKGGGKLSSATGKPAKNPFELCRDLIKQGLLGLAEPYCLKDLKAGEAKFGRNHPNVAKSRANYASLRRKKRQANKKARRGRALFLEAYNYSQGKTVKRDKAKALELYLKAAKLGNATAQYSLGLHYRGGRADNGGESKAARLLYMAARQGHRGAQSHLGGLYLKGKGLAKDPAEGALWLRAAAEQGVRYDQYRLAILYRDGRGVKRDNVEAYKWLDIALGSKISDRSRKKWGAIRAPLAARMTPAEITRAKDLAKQWKWKKKFEIVPIIAAARVLPEPTVLAKMAPIPVEPEIKVAKKLPQALPQKTAQKSPGKKVTKKPVRTAKKTPDKIPLKRRPLAKTTTADALAPGGLLNVILKSYARAINTRNLTELRSLAHGLEQITCAVGKNEKAYKKYLLKKFPGKLDPGYKVQPHPIPKGAPPPSTRLLTYPVKPTHYLTIELKAPEAKPGAAGIRLGTTIVQYVDKDDGNWKFVHGCPTKQGFANLGNDPAGEQTP